MTVFGNSRTFVTLPDFENGDKLFAEQVDDIVGNIQVAKSPEFYAIEEWYGTYNSPTTMFANGFQFNQGTFYPYPNMTITETFEGGTYYAVGTVFFRFESFIEGHARKDWVTVDGTVINTQGNLATGFGDVRLPNSTQFHQNGIVFNLSAGSHTIQFGVYSTETTTQTQVSYIFTDAYFLVMRLGD